MKKWDAILQRYSGLFADSQKKGSAIVLYKYDNDEEEYLNNKRILEGEGGEIDGCGHCCLSYKGKFIDSDGVFNSRECKWVQIIKEVSFVEKAIDNVGSWNSRFDRGYIKEIEVGLGIDLEDIKGLNEID